MENYVLVHHGVKGMKWGVRRTPAQLGHKVVSNFKKKRQAAKLQKARKRAQEEKTKQAVEAANKLKNKKISDMTDDELRTAISRARLEEEYKRLRPIEKTLKDKIKDEAVSAVSEAGKNWVKNSLPKILDKKLNEKLGIKDSSEAINELRKEFDKLNLTKQIKDLKDTELQTSKRNAEIAKNQNIINNLNKTTNAGKKDVDNSPIKTEPVKSETVNKSAERGYEQLSLWDMDGIKYEDLTKK